MAAVLALDVGGTKLAAAVVDERGRPAHGESVPTGGPGVGGEALYANLLAMARRVADAHGGPLEAVGVGCGGPARDRHRLVSPLNIAAWRDFPLQERLAADLGLAVHIDNDAKALALGEGWVGAAAGETDFLAMVVSTGVGGGIVLGGRLVDGADGNAGHIGHVFVEPGGRADANGVRGLLEGAASGTAIAALTGAPGAMAGPRMRARSGELVGRAVASVANLLDLRLAVIGGSVALGSGAAFFDAVQRTLDELCRIDHARGARVVPAGLGPAAPLVGAAAVAWRALDPSFPIR